MEPGEYVTNVLSCSNLTSINYEYFEVQTHPPATARKHLLRQEIAWRQEGRLVHCDPIRDGIWVFSAPTKPLTTSATTNETLSLIEGNGVRLLSREKGTYVPANLVRNKQSGAHSLTAPNSNASPPSSQESAVKTTLGLNARAFHQNASPSSVYEPPTPSGSRLVSGTNENGPSQRDLHEYFISAVLSSTVFHLCRTSGFVPLNSRTLISPLAKTSVSSNQTNNAPCNEVVLATLDISLTPLGSLVFKAHSDVAPGLQSLVTNLGMQRRIARLSQGASLWLAPGGTAAKYYGLPGDKTPPGNQPVPTGQVNSSHSRSTSLTPTSMHAWQSKCLQWLSAKGLDTSVLEAGGWVLVQVLGSSPAYTSTENQGIPILDDLTVVPWPALLCFQTPSALINEMQTNDANLAGSRDPLSFAEKWFTERDDRATTLLKRQKDRQAAEALSKEQADVEARAIPPNPYSPTTLRRSSNAGAVYPTPPDALHHPVGATPNFDGMVSTPSNPSAFPQHDGGANTTVNPPIPDIDADMWESSESKERSTSGANYNNENDHDAENGHDNDNDNLFGDVEGGDIFGTDITDADFSFFDEPDAIPLLEKAASSPLMNASGEQTSLPLDNSFVLTSDSNLDEVVDIEMQLQNNEIHAGEEEEIAVPLATDPEPRDLQLPESSEIIKPPQPSAGPTFDKESVFNRLFQNSHDVILSSSSTRAGLFNKIEFEKSLLSVNQKYGVNGQYKFSSQPQRPKSLQYPSLPETDFLVRRRQKSDQKQDLKISQFLKESIASPVHTADPMDYLMESDGGSQISEQDDTSNTTDSQPFPMDTSRNRNMQLLDGERDATGLPFDALVMDFEQVAHTPRSINGFQLPYLDADPADWSLTNYFTTPEPEMQSNALSDYERIAIAQILADQAVSGNLRLPSSSSHEISQRSNRSSVTRELIQNLAKAIRICFDDVTTCNLRAYLEIQGIPVLNQALRLPPRPNLPPRGLGMSDATRPSNLFNIPPPQLELRRADAKLSVLPSAATFWENLGLSPSMGSKGIDAICVYPNIEGISLFASAFLDQMRSAYESLRLGTHDKIDNKELTDGSLSFSIDTSEQNKGHQSSGLKETAGRLCRLLSSHQAEEKNFVVYFVYPVDDAALLIQICSAFQHLFNLYRKTLLDKKLTATNELVLQLVPMDFIATASSLVIQPPEEYARLAMEVYDRCTNFSLSTSSPAIMLEQPLPRSIDFKLSANPSASLLQENTCLHIAYARSIDDRWITAAWTDNRGTQQMTASYCLGRKNEALSMPFSDVANEIWETTLDYVSSKKIHWRIMIARVGVMEPSELETWTNLTTAKANTQVTLTLVTVQTDPSLRLLPKSVTLPLNGFIAQNVVTPVSTPQPSQTSIFSPENASTPTKDGQNTAPTAEPSNDSDSDARLLDYTDQTWGAVLSHRLNNSNSLLDVNPALISGYLIKRGGTSVHDPPIVIEVNIVYSEVVGNPRTFHESLLREILGYYRGLAALARVRGAVDHVRDGRPWHIAAAEKAVKALYMLM